MTRRPAFRPLYDPSGVVKHTNERTRATIMRTRRKTIILAGVLALAGVLDLGGGLAQAQSRSRSYVPNTYADFPYNQGSLFYKPLGSNASTRRKPARRRGYVSPPRAPRAAY
jgi:hypothetical protein